MARGRRVEKPATDARASVRHVPVPSRKLVTVGGHEPWTDDHLEDVLLTDDFEDAIVRLRPPTGTSDALVEEFRMALHVRRVAAVFVVPPPRPADLPDLAKSRPLPHASAREAVLALVAASNSLDRLSLRERCEELMSLEGL